jgi:hypothetical protein
MVMEEIGLLENPNKAKPKNSLKNKLKSEIIIQIRIPTI